MEEKMKPSYFVVPEKVALDLSAFTAQVDTLLDELPKYIEMTIRYHEMHHLESSHNKKFDDKDKIDVCKEMENFHENLRLLKRNN